MTGNNLEHPLDMLTRHYSNFYCLKKAVSLIMRFKSFLKDKIMSKGPITVTEMNDAEKLVILYVQDQTYPDEIYIEEQ